MTNAARIFLPPFLAGVALVATGQDATSQEPGGAVSLSAGYATSIAELQQWDAEIDAMVRIDDLVEMSLLEDERLPGREHQYVAQFFQGVPVFGGGVSRQLDRGVTVSLFGTLHQGLDIDTTPVLTAAEAGARLEAQTGATLEYGPPPELGILPLPDRSYALAYRAEMSDHRIYFTDAAEGTIVHAVDAFDTQSAIGVGVGFLGDRKKLATTSAGGRFAARDQLRPGEIVTLDMNFNEERLDFLLERGEYGVARWTASDIAVDTDNEWDDPAVADLQAHMGWTYDYFAQRHGWNGVDGRDRRVLGLVNNDFNNARYYAPWRGPEGTGALVFGVRRDRESGVEEPRVALHTVAHEAMHGVTYHAVGRRVGGDRWGIWTNLQIGFRLGPRSIMHEEREHACEDTTFQIRLQGEWTPVPAWCVAGRFLLGSYQGSAVNEAYSDIFGVSVGFFHEEAGATGTYEYSSEYTAGTIRSLSDPGSELDAASYGSRWEFAVARDDRRFYFSGALFRGGQPWVWREDYLLLLWRPALELDGPEPRVLPGRRGRDQPGDRPLRRRGGRRQPCGDRGHLLPRAEGADAAGHLSAAGGRRHPAGSGGPRGRPAGAGSVEQALRAVGLPPGRLY